MPCAQLSHCKESERPNRVGTEFLVIVNSRIPIDASVFRSIVCEAMDPVDVPAIAKGRRYAPGQMPVVTKAKAWEAGEDSSLDTKLGTLQMDVMPIGRQRHQWHMRVAGNDGRTGGRTTLRDSPVITPHPTGLHRGAEIGARLR